MTSPSFDSLGLAEPILRNLAQAGFAQPTPIQAGAIPSLMAGRDLLGIAQTGTGKTAAFALPILHRLAADPIRVKPYGARALILAPTRELAVQIETEFRRFSASLRLKSAIILGGVGRQPQVSRMAQGMDNVVGTPGRICDLMSTGHLQIGKISHFVIDEADRMLDLGFIRDIRRIVGALPVQRQSMLFSATMPTEIAKLAEGLLRDPVRIEIAPNAPPADRIEQHVHFVATAEKRGHQYAAAIECLSDLVCTALRAGEHDDA